MTPASTLTNAGGGGLLIENVVEAATPFTTVPIGNVPTEGLDPLRQLHTHMALLRLKSKAVGNWNLMLSRLDFPDLADRACDPEPTMLLDKDVYLQLAEQLETPSHFRTHILRLHMAAQREKLRADTDAGAEAREDNRRKATGEVPTVPLPPELAAITTELAFMGHLRALKTRAGLNLDSITEEMRKINPHAARARSTVGNHLKKNTVPDNEAQATALLDVLTRQLPASETAFPGGALGEHLHVWRMLINARYRLPDKSVDKQRLSALVAALAEAEIIGSAELPGLRLAVKILQVNVEQESKAA